MSIILLTLGLFFQILNSDKDTTFIFKDKLIIFPNEHEIAVWELNSNSLRTIFKIKDKNYILDLDSIKIEYGKILVMLKNESNASFRFKPGTVSEMYQTGSVYRKYYSIDLSGNSKLIKTVSSKALNDKYLELIEVNLQQYANSYKILNTRKVDVYSRAVVEYAEAKGVMLTVEQGSLFIKKKTGTKLCLIKANNDCNPKVACGCYTPFVNKNGTKGLCSYYPVRKNTKSNEKNCIVEINFATGILIKHTDIFGWNPTLSSDEKFILYKTFFKTSYELYDIEKKLKKELPKCKFVMWYTE